MNRTTIFNKTDGRCFYCGCKLDFDNFVIDHILPKSKGGKDKNNTVPACFECNAFKYNKSIEEFRNDLEEIAEKSIHTRLLVKYHHYKKKE